MPSTRSRSAMPTSASAAAARGKVSATVPTTAAPHRTSLAFPFLETIPKTKYRKSLADKTLAKQLIREKIRDVYGKHYPGKNVDEVLEHFAPDREVIALRNAQVKFRLLDKPDPPPALDFDTLKDLY